MDTEDKAWELLNSTNLNLSQKMSIRNAFTNAYKTEYPFVSRKYKKDEYEYYHSDIEQISQYNFLNKKEVLLANAIYENVKHDFNPNTFVQQLKFAFRVIGIDSAWCN